MTIPEMDRFMAAMGRPDLAAKTVEPCRMCGKPVAVPAWLGQAWSGWCSAHCMELGENKPCTCPGRRGGA